MYAAGALEPVDTGGIVPHFEEEDSMRGRRRYHSIKERNR